jgi:uncharacterized alpha/beta hydrolase family protein
MKLKFKKNIFLIAIFLGCLIIIGLLLAQKKSNNNNDKNKIDLTKEQYQIFTTDINILNAYPENKLLII